MKRHWTLALLLVGAACAPAGGTADLRQPLAALPGTAGLRAAAATGSVHARALSAPALARQCSWEPATGMCDADDAVNIMYAIRSQPSSPYLSFLMMTYDREDACTSHTSAAACKGDTGHRCLWLDDLLAAGEALKQQQQRQRPPGRQGGSDQAAAGGQTNAQERLGASLHGALLQRLAGIVRSNPLALRAATQLDVGAELRSGAASAGRPLMFAAASSQATPGGQQQRDAATPAPPQQGQAQAKQPGQTTQPEQAAQPAQAKQPGQAKQGRSAAPVCTSADLLENYVFSRAGYAEPLQAPLSLHCPGSKAHDLLRCMRLLSLDACRKTRGCAVVPGGSAGGSSSSSSGSSSSGSSSSGSTQICVSDYFKNLSSGQMTRFMADLTLAEPAVVGSCDGACWMRQALLCGRTAASPGCTAMSFCRASPSGGCGPRLYAQDNFGSSVQEFMGECANVDNQAACESYKLRLVTKGTYAAWAMPPSPAAQCAVPSIGVVLGAQRAPPGAPQPQPPARLAQERAGGRQFLTSAGALEEQAATLDAAAAAAAEAARVAQLMSARGAGGLQQLYASVASVFADA